LWLFGGPVLNGFSFCLVIGIIVGTYSSVFIASPILVFWQDWVDSRKKRAAVAAVTIKSGAQATAAAGAGRAKPVK
jgi:preprotein translocase subunit SecF